MYNSHRLRKLFLIFSLFISISNAVPLNEIVADLPGLNFKPNFLHYSGYLRASSQHYLHYWFVESQGISVAEAPVILWLNGGPGCSSVGGLMDELGPFRAKDFGDTIFENIYAWNKIGSVLFIESPAGVGYSFTNDGNVTTDDDQVARDNYNALIHFFESKFPELKNNDFYIMGESYAGIYLPTLGVLLIDDKDNFPNFKGMAIGNGLLDQALNYNTMIPLFYNHGLMRQSLWDDVAVQCCAGNPSKCDYFHKIKDEPCRSLILEQLDASSGLDPYNLYSSCYYPFSDQRSFIRNRLWRMGGVQQDEANDVDPEVVISLPICAQLNSTQVYLNRADVRKSLHIPDFLPQWSNCNNEVGQQYKVNYFFVYEQVDAIANAGVRVLIYNGDVDSVCNGIMNIQFLNALNRTILGDNPYSNQAWTYANEKPNIAGYVTRFQGGIDFVTVRGAGHFVPTDKGREALQLIYNFVYNRDYSLPTGLNITPQPLVTE